MIRVLLAVLLAWSTVPALAQTRPAERPTYEVGDVWVINTNHFTLVRIENDTYVYTAPGDREIRMSRDLVITKLVNGGRPVWELGGTVEWPWPLEIGKRRHGKHVGPRGTADAIVSVDAIEDVEVKAGRFKAFKVTTQVIGDQGRPVRVLTSWYAPEVRRIVKSGNTGGQVLNFEVTGIVDRGTTVAQQSSGPAARSGPVERPAYAVGDRWNVGGVAYELSQVTRDGYVFSGSGRHEIQLTKDLAVSRVVRGGRIVYDVSVPPRWPWPLGVGKFNQSRTVVTSAPEGALTRGGTLPDGDFVVVTNVEGFEVVAVAGGRFGALRITEEWSKQVRGAPLSYWRTTLWYAPELRRIVKVENTGVTALNFELTGVEESGPAVASTPAPAPAKPVAEPKAVPAAPAAPTDAEAPKIAINYPAADMKVDAESIVILGLVTDNLGVDRVLITINGVEIAQPRDVASVGRGVPVRAPAALRPGPNVIEITAADKAGNVSQVVRTVTRAAPAVATPAAPPVPKVSNRWAVVVGVGEYDNRAIPKLRFATRDAEAMYQFLTTQGGYPKDNVVLLTDTTAQKPTLLNIKRALGDFLARRAGRDDMVLIYFAGHGAPEVDAGGIEADGLSKYLIPRDGDPDSLYTTALPMDEIQRIFARVAAERIVMLLDTCYSGNAGGRTFARASTRAAGLNDQFLDRLTRSRGRVIITASGPNEVALELPTLGHGVFTYYVLEGLKGKADRNNDGLVTVSELYEYVEDQVDSTARRAGGRQRPLMKGEIEGTLPLSKTR